MKLIFRKNDKEEVSVFQSVDGKEQPFAYPQMVKTLLSVGSLEPPEISEGFSTEEVESIHSMINRINDVMTDQEPESESPQTEV